MHGNNLLKQKVLHKHPDSKGFGFFLTKNSSKPCRKKFAYSPDEGSAFFVEFITKHMNPIKTISIIDDDAVFVFLTKKAIELAHIAHQVKVFVNGWDAISYFKENIECLDLMPDVILLDLSMPIMDGWQFLD